MLLMGLFFGGCILEGPTTTWLGRPRVFQGPTGPDVIQLDVAILEGPVGNQAFNHDLWGATDEQAIAPETQAALEENGLRVGQMGGIAPVELQALLTSERSCVRSRRIQLRSGMSQMIELGPTIAQGRFVLHEKGGDTSVMLEQVGCAFSLVPTLAADSKTRLQFTPRTRNHGASRDSNMVDYDSLRWEITLAPNDYLLIGGRYDRSNTLGWQWFIRPDEDAPVQRLLVIRTTRSALSVDNEVASNPSRKPTSFAESPSLAAQASGAR
jgi:hypothetical protein